MISIIIPAYNVEKYISRSLQCCLQQTFSDLEVLVINDGSKDSTAKIVKSFEIKDSRIHLINKPNGGLVSARKEALKYIKGDYVFFMDADDIIDNNTLDVLSAYRYDYDIIIGDFILESESLNVLPFQHVNTLKYFGGENATYNNYLSKSVTASLCGRLIKIDLLKDFCTPLDITIGEDFVTNLIMVRNHNPKLKIVNEPFYHYIQYPHSMVNNKTKKNLLKRMYFSNWVIDFFKKENLQTNVEIKDNLSFHVLDEYYSFLRDGGSPNDCVNFTEDVNTIFWNKFALNSLPKWKNIMLHAYHKNVVLGNLIRFFLNNIRCAVKKIK